MARIETITLKSGATVTMHTRFSWEEVRAVHRRRAEIRKLKDEIAKDFAGLKLFLTDWTLRDVESDEPLDFSPDGLRRADAVDIAEIGQLMDRTEEGERPNGSSASSPAT